MCARKSGEESPLKKPHAEGLTLRDVREARGVSRQALAQSLGLKDADLLSKLERGDREMSREKLDWALGPLDPPPGEVEALLFAHRLALRETPAEPGLTREELLKIDHTALGAAWTAAEMLRPMLIRRKKSEKTAAALREADSLLRLLKSRSPADRRDLVAVFPRLRTCALVARVCDASVKAAASLPGAALELAQLACFLAERVDGGEGRRSRARGYAHAFASNAQRVATDFDAADATFRRAWELWQAGTAADPDPLAEWRLLDLEASLRREQHRFAEALVLLDRARSACEAGPGALGLILLNKANVEQQSENFAGALDALEEASPMVEASGDPHLLFSLFFNTSTNLAFLERYAEAAKLLPSVRELAVQQGNVLGLTRVLWLAARVDAGQGQGEEALAGLEQVRRDFTAHTLPYEAALSSLDMAVLLLKRGRTAEVKELAVAMAWIFKANGIAREALAALALFCEAARQDAATVELAQRVIAEIEKAQRLALSRPAEE
jgi:transcriptional regulator with XRE-family HTH domain